jgi:H+-transporting ATPase
MRATVIKYLHTRRERALRAETAAAAGGAPVTRTQSRAASVHASLYSNRVGFLRRAARRVGLGGKVRVRPEELQRFSSLQAQQTGATLARNPSRAAA